MRRHLAILTILFTGALGTGACATSEQWAEWHKHSSHFASGDHLFFSLRNRGGKAPRVSRSDLETARQESWWGEAIVVRPDQLFEG